MSKPLKIHPVGTCLITALAQHLLEQGGAPERLTETKVILPTQRLANQLAKHMSYRQAVFLPQIYNLDRFVSEHSFSKPCLAAEQLELLMARMIREEGGNYLNTAHAHEACQLLTEFTDHGITEEAFDQLDAVIEECASLCDERLETLHGRSQEMRSIFGRLLAYLDEHGLTYQAALKAQQSLAASQIIANEPNPIYMVGFTSHVRRDEPLLRAMAQNPQCQCWVSTEPMLMPNQITTGPFERFTALWGESPERDDRMKVSPLLCRAAATPFEEVAMVIRLAEEAIEQGYSPSSLAILVPDDNLYGPLLRNLLPRATFSYNNALATSLADSDLGRFLSALFTYMEEPSGPLRLLSLICHPWVLQYLDSSQKPLFINCLISENLANAPAHYDLKALTAEARGPVKTIYERFATWLQPLMDQSHQELCLEDWLEAFGKVTAAVLEGAKPTDPDAIHLHSSALQGYQQLLDLLGHEQLRSVALEGADFLQLVASKFLALSIQDVGDQLKGVQVLSIAEARYVPFQQIFLLGCAEGIYPAPLPRDLLIDNSLKQKLGLPGWEFIEAIEESTFAQLRARIPMIHTSWPLESEKGPGTKSHFIERDLGFARAEEVSCDSYRDLLTLLAERNRLPHPIGEAQPAKVEGKLPELDIAEMTASFSATSLENFIRCPYRFLMQKLRVQSLAFAPDEDARLEGEWLHEIIEVFYRGKSANHEVDEGFDTSIDPETLRQYCLDRLQQITTIVAPAYINDGPTGLHLRHKSWPNYADFICRNYDASNIKLLSETMTEFTFPKEGWARGRIDAVNKLDDDTRIVIDYKRRNAPEATEVRVGLRPQLLLYARGLAELNPEDFPLKDAIIGYYNILDGEWLGRGAGAEAMPKAKERNLISAKEKVGLEAMVGNMNHLTAWRTDLVTSDQAWRVDRGDEKYCGYCDFQDLCRLNDPETEAPGYTQPESSENAPITVKDYIKGKK